MLHAGILHSVAACVVGRHNGGDPKAQHLRPDISSAAQSAGWQAHNFVSEWVLTQYGSVAVWRTVHDRALRWSGGRPRLAEDAQVASEAPSPNKTKDHKSHRHTRSRRARRQPELAVRSDWRSRVRIRNDRPIPDAV